MTDEHGLTWEPSMATTADARINALESRLAAAEADRDRYIDLYQREDGSGWCCRLAWWQGHQNPSWRMSLQ